MKLLLIQAPYFYIHQYAYRTEILGQLYIAAAARQAGHEVYVEDPTLGDPTPTPQGFYYGGSPAELETTLKRIKPDVVGITCHNTYSVSGAEMIGSLAKKVFGSHVVTVAGGLYPSVHKDTILIRCPSLGFALQGESEQSFLSFLALIAAKGENFESIDGLIFRRDDKVVVNKKSRFIDNLDSLPYPARDLVDISRYMNSSSRIYGLGNKPVLSLLTSRSCPNKCTFCNMWLVHGPRWRPRSAENVVGEISEMVHRYGAQHIFIMDDNFTFDGDRVKSICEQIIRKELRIRWNTPNGISVAKVDKEMANLMKRSGCANICIAIESGSDYIRNTVMKKRISKEQIINSVTCFKAAGIPVGGFLILGMPGETAAHFQETVEFVRKVPLSFIVVSFVYPFPGTKLYEDLIKEGILGENFDYTLDCYFKPAFTTKDFTEQDLYKRRWNLLWSFYLSHIPGLTKDLFLGRLNWIGSDLFKRFWREKILSTSSKDNSQISGN